MLRQDQKRVTKGLAAGAETALSTSHSVTERLDITGRGRPSSTWSTQVDFEGMEAHTLVSGENRVVEASMTDKLNVTVDEATRQITVGFSVGALSRSIVIDLTDMKSVADGLVQVFSVSQQHLQCQLNGLAKRLETLEKLSTDDWRFLADMVRQNRRDIRGDETLRVDELANKLDVLAKT
jgi:hypothetical protein